MSLLDIFKKNTEEYRNPKEEYIKENTQKNARNGLGYSPNECFQDIRDSLPISDYDGIHKRFEKKYQNGIETKNSEYLIIQKGDYYFVLTRNNIDKSVVFTEGKGHLQIGNSITELNTYGNSSYSNTESVDMFESKVYEVKDDEMKGKIFTQKMVPSEDTMRNVYSYVLTHKNCLLKKLKQKSGSRLFGNDKYPVDK